MEKASVDGDANRSSRTIEVMVDEAVELFNAGRFDESLALLDQTLALQPDYTRAQVGRTFALRRLGRPEDALRAGMETLKANAESAIAHSAVAICLHVLGRDGEAQKYYKRSIRLAPDSARVNYNYACYWADLGTEELCRKYLEISFDCDGGAFFNKLAPTDADLAPLREKTWFRVLLTKAETANEKHPEKTSG